MSASESFEKATRKFLEKLLSVRGGHHALNMKESTYRSYRDRLRDGKLSLAKMIEILVEAGYYPRWDSPGGTKNITPPSVVSWNNSKETG
jgi:hypothetical protein